MEQVVPWKTLLALIEPAYPKAGSATDPTPWTPCCASIFLVVAARGPRKLATGDVTLR